MSVIWKKPFTMEILNSFCRKGLMAGLGISFTAFGDDWMEARMPVDDRTRQPYGYLHGGATAALIETLGSIAGNYAADKAHSCMGLDIETHHLRAVREGFVTAHAVPRHLGSSVQVWLVTVRDEENNLIAEGHMTLAVRRHMSPAKDAAEKPLEPHPEHISGTGHSDSPGKSAGSA